MKCNLCDVKEDLGKCPLREGIHCIDCHSDCDQLAWESWKGI